MKPAHLLLRWFRTHGRQLAWRGTRDPYRILVSEMMLQQTQVSRVNEFFPRWLKQFPQWKILARASNGEVIRAWAGLGYNRRALMLRDIARHITAQGVPGTRDEWRALKGIGTYTSAALTAFSLREKIFPIDTNIRRVAGRYLIGKPFADAKDDKKIERASSPLLDTPQWFDIPQALFDLATMICTKSPECMTCPLRATCKAAPKFLNGRVKIPKRSTKKAQETRHRDKSFPDRIYRGRILTQLREQKWVSVKNLGHKIDSTFNETLDGAWLLRMIDRLERDGLVVRKRGYLELPE